MHPQPKINHIRVVGMQRGGQLTLSSPARVYSISHNKPCTDNREGHNEATEADTSLDFVSQP